MRIRMFLYCMVLALSAALIYCETHNTQMDERILIGPHDVFKRDLQIGQQGQYGNDVLGLISDVLVDSLGNIFILDYKRCNVKKFSHEGQYLTTIGQKGWGPGEFAQPTGLAMDNSGKLYVSDEGNRNVSKFNAEGEFIGEFTIEFFPQAIGLDSKGNIYLVGLKDGKVIHKYDQEGQHIVSFCKAFESDDDRIKLVYSGGDIFVSGETIYFTQRTPYEIRKFSSDGTLIAEFSRKADFFSPPEIDKYEGDGDCEKCPGYTFHPFTYSGSIVVMSDGRVLNEIVTKQRKKLIDVYDPQGQIIEVSIQMQADLKCVDSNGCLYFSHRDPFPTLVRYVRQI